MTPPTPAPAAEQRKIYQVWGSCGSYEEYEHNLLATYADSALADEHVRLATQRKAELELRHNQWNNWQREHEGQYRDFRGKSIYDPHLTSEFGMKTDMNYSVKIEPVRVSVPKARGKR